MWIKRDLYNTFNAGSALEAIYLKGPRQIGKSTLLAQFEPKPITSIYLDDANIRTRANQDPEFLLSQSPPPVLIDEAHLAPPIFFAIKKRIDESRRNRVLNSKDPSQKQNILAPCSFRLTGSNLTEVNQSVQETLAGRVSLFFLHGISWNEITEFAPDALLSEYLFRGGFPELWVRRELNPVDFINDYISSFIEKDLARSIGIEKRMEFVKVLRLVAARTGELLNYESIGNDADVKGKTVKQWLSLLSDNRIIHILEPYASNLNKRLIKMPKAYFIDTGICARLQSHQSPQTLMNSAQAGHLFESMVISEVIKTKDHFRKDWNLFYWRTKEKEEIDLIIEEPNRINLIEIKLGSSSSSAFAVPRAIQQTGKKIKSFIVTATGEPHFIAQDVECLPLKSLVQRLIAQHKMS
jgi:predicted AAA+ superfamily ATPase